MTDTTVAVDTAAVPKKNKLAGDGVDAELVGRLVEQARAAGPAADRRRRSAAAAD